MDTPLCFGAAMAMDGAEGWFVGYPTTTVPVIDSWRLQKYG